MDRSGEKASLIQAEALKQSKALRRLSNGEHELQCSLFIPIGRTIGADHLPLALSLDFRHKGSNEAFNNCI